MGFSSSRVHLFLVSAENEKDDVYYLNTYFHLNWLPSEHMIFVNVEHEQSKFYRRVVYKFPTTALIVQAHPNILSLYIGKLDLLCLFSQLLNHCLLAASLNEKMCCLYLPFCYYMC